MISVIINSTPQSFTYYKGTTAERLALSSSLNLADEGKVWFYDTNDKTTYFWNGINWR